MEKIERFANFINKKESDYIFDYLNNAIKWHDTLLNNEGEPVKIKRKMAYIFNYPVSYKYANLNFLGETWGEHLELTSFINKLTAHTGIIFNSVLLNYYKNGKDEIKWHSDKEEQLGDIKESVIATINLGATRKFWYLNKETGEKNFHSLEHGDLLMMNAGFQDKYLHAILPEKEIKEPRISLTFRKVIHE